MFVQRQDPTHTELCSAMIPDNSPGASNRLVPASVCFGLAAGLSPWHADSIGRFVTSWISFYSTTPSTRVHACSAFLQEIGIAPISWYPLFQLSSLGAAPYPVTRNIAARSTQHRRRCAFRPVFYTSNKPIQENLFETRAPPNSPCAPHERRPSPMELDVLWSWLLFS